MPTFVRKQTSVEAVQWRPGTHHPGINWSGPPASLHPHVVTNNGPVGVEEGDWLLPEPGGTGRYYPVKPDVFAASYIPLGKDNNPYEKIEIVRRGNFLRAGPVQLGEYTVRDPLTGEYGKRQFHMTYDNTVMAVMGEESAKLFARFVSSALDGRAMTDKSPGDKLVEVCRRFLDEHRVTCAETTVEDRVYMDAPTLVLEIAAILGYAKGDDDEAEVA